MSLRHSTDKPGSEQDRDDLIAALTHDLPAVKPAMNVDRVAMIWLAICAIWVVAVTYFWGPIRDNALVQLLTEPRFTIETLFGVLAIVVGALVAFRSSVPGASSARLTIVGGGLLVSWLSFYVYGLTSPSLEPSMLGKRETCVWETMVYALPPMVLAFAITRRFYPLQPVRTAMSFSLVAGMVPALYMQIACMYVPSHILKFHIMPGLLAVIVGAVIALAIEFLTRKG